MAKAIKEVSDKKHNVRRAFLISTIAVGILAAGAAAMAVFSASPILLAIDCAVLAVAAFTAVGSGVAINKLRDSSLVRKSKKQAKKSLEEIRELNNDKSSTYSQEYRAKVVRKFANANLTLCQRRGGTSFGVFHSSSGLSDKRATEYINNIDAYSLLRDSAKTKGQQKKYSKKIELEERKLAKIIQEEGITTNLQRWTKSYDNVVRGVSVLDRRTEIACLTSTARDEYMGIFNNSNEVTDDKALNVVVKFNDSSNMRPTMARAEDQSKLAQIKEILLKDVVESCKGKTALEVKSMFPIVLETRIINKTSTKILNNDAIEVSNLTELKQLLEPVKTK